MISSFSGEFSWLSNFYSVPIEYKGLRFHSVEAAFQAQKTLNPIEKIKFSNILSPSEAKKLGRKVTLRPDWEQIKDQIMYDLLKEKFKHPTLKRWLIETGDEELIEGNSWHDTYWGVYEGTGKNTLGKLLMKLREELKS